MKNPFGKNFIFIPVLIVILALLAGCTAGRPVYEFSEDKDQGDLVLYVFWGDGCSHCEDAKPMLARLDEQYPTLNIHSFEVWNSAKNADLYTKMADTYNLPQGGRGTPTFFLGEKQWVGYSEAIDEDISTAVAEYAKTGAIDAGQGIMPGAAAAN